MSGESSVLPGAPVVILETLEEKEKQAVDEVAQDLMERLAERRPESIFGLLQMLEATAAQLRHDYRNFAELRRMHELKG